MHKSVFGITEGRDCTIQYRTHEANDLEFGGLVQKLARYSLYPRRARFELVSAQGTVHSDNVAAAIGCEMKKP